MFILRYITWIQVIHEPRKINVQELCKLDISICLLNKSKTYFFEGCIKVSIAEILKASGANSNCKLVVNLILRMSMGRFVI